MQNDMSKIMPPPKRNMASKSLGVSVTTSLDQKNTYNTFNIVWGSCSMSFPRHFPTQTPTHVFPHHLFPGPIRISSKLRVAHVDASPPRHESRSGFPLPSHHGLHQRCGALGMECHPGEPQVGVPRCWIDGWDLWDNDEYMGILYDNVGE